jgi:hypothetical protein
MTLCTSKTNAGHKCRMQARSGSTRCATHLKHWQRKSQKHKDPHSALNNAIDASITGLNVLRKHDKGEMKRRLDDIFRDILLYYLAMGPYPEDIGL